MDRKRAAMAGVGAAMLLGALVAPPALSAAVDARAAVVQAGTLIGRFTPAVGDPRLMAQYALVSDRAKRDFRFTPVVARPADARRAITLVVRSRSQSLTAETVASRVLPKRDPSITIAPVAYNLGTSVGFSRFVLPETGSRVDISALPRTAAVEGVAQRPSRFSTELTLDRDTRSAASSEHSVAFDLGAGYDISRTLKVTAGVRYKQEADRLAPLADDRRDSQAVYVGTRVRF